MKISDLIKRFKSDEKLRYKIGFYSGAFGNLVLAVIQIYGGIKSQSVWFIALAVYYAVLAIINLFIGLSVNKKGKDAWRAFRTVGFILTIFNIALIVMISIMIAIYRYDIRGEKKLADDNTAGGQ